MYLILPSEKAMAPYSSTLAWKIPWMEEPGGLQSIGSLRVGLDWATSLSLFTFMHWRRKWQPTPVFLPRESQGQGSLVGSRLWDHTELDTTEVTWQQQQHSLVKWFLKFSKPGFSNTWTMNFQMFKLDLEKAQEPEIKLPISTGSSKKQESSKKKSISALLIMPKPLTMWITINCGKFWKRWKYQPT